MTFSVTARRLSKAIEASKLTQREISDKVGFKHASVIEMMKNGVTRVPLDRIPALARTLGIDERQFLILAIHEYHPGIHEVLVETLGLPLTDAELGIITMFRMAHMRDDIELSEPFKKILEGLLEIAAFAER